MVLESNLSLGIACQRGSRFKAAVSLHRFLSTEPTDASPMEENGAKPCASEPAMQSKSEQNAGNNHSYEENIRKSILQASLPYVEEHGWSKNAISAGAESLGYPGVIHGMFPRGGADLVNYFCAECNQQLVGWLQQEADKQTSPACSDMDAAKALVLAAVEVRLRMTQPYLSRWPQALGIMALPPNMPTALANLLTLVDDICYYAGDRSVDFSWYSRRVALAGIYKTTELYMLQDTTPSHDATWRFLARRVDEAAQLHLAVRQSETASQTAKEVAAAAFTTARNILGLNWNR